MSLSPRRMYAALVASDAAYDGRFWVGVRTTGIYCRPSCRARKPRFENLRFAASREELAAAGFRACKKCHPETWPETAPAWLPVLLEHMRARCPEPVHEGRLAALAGRDISTVRRAFRRYLGASPMAYQRRLRLLVARERLVAGEDALQVGLACGFDSDSGFRAAFRREFGLTPGALRRGGV